jgi:protein TonB
MFETSVVRERVGNSRRASLLTASLVAHTVVVLGAVGVSIASVDFPRTAPDEYSAAPVFASVQIPPPLGNPNGGARPEPQPAVKPPAPVPQTNEITAPSTVPDQVTPAQSQATTTATGDSTGSDAPGLVPGPVGVPWGDPNSVANDLNLPPAIVETPQVEDRIYQSSEVKAPVVLRRVEPRYPNGMLRAGMSAKVVVRCIIDKNGNVRDPQVIVSSMPPFNAAVIDAVQQWKFTPGSLHGHAVDTYLDLTVNFATKR